MYESLSALSIGRVFYTQAERELLDLRRDRPEVPVAGAANPGSGKQKADEHKDAAGYIISSSGRSRVWAEGDFVPSSQDEIENVSFPGDVGVERHSEADGHEE